MNKNKAKDDLVTDKRDGHPGADVMVIISLFAPTRKRHTSLQTNIFLYTICPSPPWILITSTLRE